MSTDMPIDRPERTPARRLHSLSNACLALTIVSALWLPLWLTIFPYSPLSRLLPFWFLATAALGIALLVAVEIEVFRSKRIAREYFERLLNGDYHG